MSNTVLVRFYMTEEENDAGFVVSGHDMCTSNLSLTLLMKIWVSCCRLLLRWTPRTEVVLETTFDDARRVRQILVVNRISHSYVKQNGRVRITVDVPESVIPEVTPHSCIWSRSSLCATIGFLLYQSVEQWEELSSLLTNEVWFSGRVLCESPRWVLVDTSTGLLSDDVNHSVEGMACRWSDFSRHFLPVLACQQGESN